jgi:exodeoxyribonuclease V alpha subunit
MNGAPGMDPCIDPRIDPGIDMEEIRKRGFSELAVRFACLMTGFCGRYVPELFQACLLLSRSRDEGNICIDLSGGSGYPEGVGAALPGDSSRWAGILRETPVVGLPGDFRPLILDGTALYLYRYWKYEADLASGLVRLASAIERADPSARDDLDRLFPREGGQERRTGAVVALLKKLCILSGGPGTGKTTAVARIIALLAGHALPEKPRIALAAPTGKAAARLSEVIRAEKDRLDCADEVRSRIPDEARTIHRLLGTVSGSPYFRHNAGNPLPADLVVVDEASMVDLPLLSKLVDALPQHARLILLGDRDQLASVEAGAALGDICRPGETAFSRAFREAARPLGEDFPGTGGGAESGIADCIVRLEKSHRFGPQSGIGALSRAVRSGDSAGAETILTSGRDDVKWKNLSSGEAVARELRESVVEGYRDYLRAPGHAEAYDLFGRFRMLCALREGPFGAGAVNRLAEEILRREGLIRKDSAWYRGRPLLITRNDYRLKLFNGDVGLIHGPDSRAFFPGPDGFRGLPPLRLPDHETVYAMTVHKSQGSEFDKVVLVLPDRDTPLLSRELVYTAVTRARQGVEVWGKMEVFKAAVERRTERRSGLARSLWGE